MPSNKSSEATHYVHLYHIPIFEIYFNKLVKKQFVSVSKYMDLTVCVHAYMCIKLLLTLCGLEKKKHRSIHTPPQVK